MATQKKADKFYYSQAWFDTRIKVLRRDRWRCVWCGAGVHYKGAARVDHIVPRKQAPELALEMKNLRTLCASCDNKRHNEKRRTAEDWGASQAGQPRDPAHWWNAPDYKKLRAGDGDN